VATDSVKLGNVDIATSDEDLDSFIRSRAPRANVTISEIDYVEVGEHGEVIAHLKVHKINVKRSKR
jgi:flavin-binding protein dodecin